jgi:hypothetical protein
MRVRDTQRNPIEVGSGDTNPHRISQRVQCLPNNLANTADHGF